MPLRAVVFGLVFLSLPRSARMDSTKKICFSRKFQRRYPGGSIPCEQEWPCLETFLRESCRPRPCIYGRVPNTSEVPDNSESDSRVTICAAQRKSKEIRMRVMTLVGACVLGHALSGCFLSTGMPPPAIQAPEETPEITMRRATARGASLSRLRQEHPRRTLPRRGPALRSDQPR